MAGKRRAGGSTATPDGSTRSARRAARRSAPRARLTRGQRVVRAAKWLLATSLVGILVVTGGLFAVYETIDIPSPNEAFKTQTSFVYYDDGKDELGTYAVQQRTVKKLAQIPKALQDAVIAIENRSFYTDSGIDPKGILRAAFSNAKGGSTQGASTITQQYVKILYLSQERTVQRKLKEAVISLKIRREQSKEEILEGYLNTIYFGRGAYGVEAAAQAYFDKGVNRLNVPQCAVLAAVLNDPNDLDPADGGEARVALRGRYQQVLKDMVEMDTLDQAKATRYARHLPKFPKIKSRSQKGGQRGFMLDLVRDDLDRLRDEGKLDISNNDIDGGGLRITTTFSRKAMDAAKAGALAQKPEGRQFRDSKLHIAVASVEPGTGALRGFYGGQDYLRSQINWAEAGGMVGSTMKPFTLATALENGFALKDTFQGNSPYEFPDGTEVSNEDEGRGDQGERISATLALEQSVNTAFVDMSQSIPDGPEKIFRTAEKMGIPPAVPSSKYPGIPDTSGVDFTPKDTLITLGKAKLSPINMANAYATIANGGKRAVVHVVEKVVAPDGTVLYDGDEDAPKPKRALDEDVAADVSYAMQQVVTSGTGRAALGLGRPAAGKTGTATADAKDGEQFVSSAWFVGFTPQLSTAVMYVRGKGTGRLDGWLPEFFGGSYPARTWTDVMTRDMAGLDVEDFPPPAYVDGEAPTDGHAPVATQAPPPDQGGGGGGGPKGPDFTPPPIGNSPSPGPTQPTAPTQGPTQPTTGPTEPTDGPTTPTSQPTQPTQGPTTTPGCAILGGCSTPTPQPTEQPTSSTPTPTPTPTGGGGGGTGGGPSPRPEPATTPRRHV